MNRINIRGLRIIMRSEGCRLKGYICPAGVPTIGYGSTGLDYYNTDEKGRPTKITTDTVWTSWQAKDRLRKDIFKFSQQILRHIVVDINDNQFSAIVSFVYNVGIGNFKRSTLLKKLNRGDIVGASNEFLRWNRAGGRVLNGLIKRREAERELFLLNS